MRMMLHKKITADKIKKIVNGAYTIIISPTDHHDNGKRTQLEKGRILNLDGTEYVVTSMDKTNDGAHEADIFDPNSFTQANYPVTPDYPSGTLLEWVLNEDGNFKEHK